MPGLFFILCGQGDLRGCSVTNIKNIKGDEKPTISGDSVNWSISGDDLYYQGESTEKLPDNVSIKYELNGN